MYTLYIVPTAGAGTDAERAPRAAVGVVGSDAGVAATSEWDSAESVGCWEVVSECRSGIAAAETAAEWASRWAEAVETVEVEAVAAGVERPRRAVTETAGTLRQRAVSVPVQRVVVAVALAATAAEGPSSAALGADGASRGKAGEASSAARDAARVPGTEPAVNVGRKDSGTCTPPWPSATACEDASPRASVPTRRIIASAVGVGTGPKDCGTRTPRCPWSVRVP